MTVALEERISVKQSMPVISRRRQWATMTAFIVCCIVAAVVLVPLITTVLGGLRTNGELLNAPFSFPTSGLHFDNYKKVLALDSPFWPALINSLLIVIGTVGLLIVVASPAAFALARISFPGREV